MCCGCTDCCQSVQSNLETVHATLAAFVEAGREFAVASVSEDVLDDLEADLEVLLAAAGVVTHLIDFVVPVVCQFRSH